MSVRRVIDFSVEMQSVVDDQYGTDNGQTYNRSLVPMDREGLGWGNRFLRVGILPSASCLSELVYKFCFGHNHQTELPPRLSTTNSEESEKDHKKAQIDRIERTSLTGLDVSLGGPVGRLVSQRSMLHTHSYEISLASNRDSLSQNYGSIIFALQTIDSMYNIFQEVQIHNMDSLGTCIDLLEKVDRFYKQFLPQVDNAASNTLKMRFQKAQQQVREMNARSSILTRQDLQDVGDFFQSPKESVYFDPHTQETYIQPDHSTLLAFGSTYCARGGYLGIGLSRCQTYAGKLCDVLYLKKKQDQVDYEYPRGWLFQMTPHDVWERYYAPVSERVSVQRGFHSRIFEVLKEKIVEWKYADFAICEYPGLIRNGLSEKHAKENHAIFFYYQKSV
jgi:hypothetical protein